MKKYCSIFLGCLVCTFLVSHSPLQALNFKKKMEQAGKKMKGVLEKNNPKKFFDKKKSKEKIDDEALEELLKKMDRDELDHNKFDDFLNDNDLMSTCGCGCHDKEKKSDEIPPDTDE